MLPHQLCTKEFRVFVHKLDIADRCISTEQDQGLLNISNGRSVCSAKVMTGLHMALLYATKPNPLRPQTELKPCLGWADACNTASFAANPGFVLDCVSFM